MISVNAGQCGNQLGYCIIDSLYDHLNDENDTFDARNLEHFFRRSEKRKKWVARSVCLDTEPKVIHECFERAKQSKNWVFNETGAAYEHGGAGNNVISTTNHQNLSELWVSTVGNGLSDVLRVVQGRFYGLHSP
jgi:hypothetical protein